MNHEDPQRPAPMVAPMTLIEYARTRSVDPTALLTLFTDTPDQLPTPVGERAGQPTYDPDELDRARGLSTLAGFAAWWGVDLGEVRRWWERQPGLWPAPVGEVRTGESGNPAYLFPLGGLERVAEAEAVRRGREEVPEGLVTLDEFAAEEALNVKTLKFHWRGKPGFPAPAEGPSGGPLKRGRAFLYWRGELLGFVSGRV